MHLAHRSIQISHQEEWKSLPTCQLFQKQPGIHCMSYGGNGTWVLQPVVGQEDRVKRRGCRSSQLSTEAVHIQDTPIRLPE